MLPIPCTCAEEDQRDENQIKHFWYRTIDATSVLSKNNGLNTIRSILQPLSKENLIGSVPFKEPLDLIFNGLTSLIANVNRRLYAAANNSRRCSI